MKCAVEIRDVRVGGKSEPVSAMHHHVALAVCCRSFAITRKEVSFRWGNELMGIGRAVSTTQSVMRSKGIAWRSHEW